MTDTPRLVRKIIENLSYDIRDIVLETEFKTSQTDEFFKAIDQALVEIKELLKVEVKLLENKGYSVEVMQITQETVLYDVYKAIERVMK